MTFLHSGGLSNLQFLDNSSPHFALYWQRGSLILSALLIHTLLRFLRPTRMIGASFRSVAWGYFTILGAISPWSLVFLCASTLLLSWRLWMFTVKPWVWPRQPKELPYWIPCKKLDLIICTLPRYSDHAADNSSVLGTADRNCALCYTHKYLGHTFAFFGNSDKLLERGLYTPFPSPVIRLS